MNGIDQWFCTASRRHEVPLAPPLGELLSECEAEGVRFAGWYKPMISAAPVGEALSLPLRRSRLGFPPGETAERSEADEGWRQVGSGMQLTEWHMF